MDRFTRAQKKIKLNAQMLAHHETSVFTKDLLLSKLTVIMFLKDPLQEIAHEQTNKRSEMEFFFSTKCFRKNEIN